MNTVRHTFRLLRRAPGFSAVVILTLALGIGANATIYSAVRSVLFRPLPYANGDRIVTVASDNHDRGWLNFGTSVPDLRDFQKQSRTLDHVAAYWSGFGNLNAGDRPERVAYATVSPELFAALGTQPILGRTFAPEEDLEGQDGVVVLSWRFWQASLGGREDVLDQEVLLDQRRLQIIGVMPTDFVFPKASVDLWKPFGFTAADGDGRGQRWLSTIAALAPGASLEEAGAEMSQISARLAAAYPASNSGWTTSVLPYRSTLTADVRPALLLGWVAVAIVLLIASANVANLFLARYAEREQELAVRTAVGASGSQMLRQMLGESLVFATLGGALGLVVALLGVRGLAIIAPEELTSVGGLSLDWTVLVYCAGLVLLTGLLFGVLPVIRSSRSDLYAVLRQGGRGGPGIGSHRLRGGLVVTELALAVVVLVGAGLTVRSFTRLLSVDPGFEVESRLSLRLAPSRVALTEREQAVRFFDQILDNLGRLPGVEGVGAINVLPVPGGGWWLSSIWPEGKSYREGEEPVTATRVVAGQYFETMGIQLRSGRVFEPTDAASSDPVVIIDRTAAEQYWPGENPIGRPLSFERPSGDNVTWFRVVGIVDAVRHEDLDVAPTPMAYMPLAQAQFGHFRDWGMSVVIRSAGDPMALVRPARAAITSVAPDVPIYEVQPLQEMVSNNLAERRFTLIILTVFAGIALTLAAVGIYAVLAMTVAERTREVGIRMALGADGRAVLAWVVRDGLWKTALGLGIGLGVALAGSRLMTSLVYEIAGADPATYGAVAAVLGTVALAASIIPAWRATRIDPIEALRGE